MESSGEAFDVVAVVVRAQRMKIAGASPTELAWADRAADLVRGWADAWQAQVQFEMTLPRPLPELDDATADPSPDDATDRDATDASDRDATTEATDRSSTDAGAEAGAEDAPAGEPLPSLGAAPQPLESRFERERKARRAWLLSALSAFAEALRTGRITTAHVDILAAALDKLPGAIAERVLARGDELLTAALTKTPEKFSRAIHQVIAKAYDDEGIDRAAAQRARSSLRRGVDDATKMHWLRLELDPERGGLLFRRLDAEREALFNAGQHKHLTGEQLELQALLNLIAPVAATAAGSPAPVRTQKSSTKKLRALVLIDVETLLQRAGEHTVCENDAGIPLPPETVRRLLCIAEVTYGLLINGRVVASVVGNDLATPEQRHELRMMYRTCCHPGCQRRFDHCQIHHIIARSRHGATDVALMVPLCNEHHDAIHHRGWALSIDTDRNLTWTAPNGTVHECPFVPLADLDQLTLFNEQSGRAPPPAA